ncbi:MAG TPA: PH domain-containing protein [Acidimicrobiales bacterium]|nr:PH domain-containing protein [Acidimicrobiales bacterium]
MAAKGAVGTLQVVSFPRRLLNEGEEVVIDLRPHWSFLIGPVLAAIGVIVVAVAILAAFPSAPAVVIVAILLLLVTAMLWLAGRYARWASTSFVLTNNRVVYRTGILSRRGREIPLDRLNDISVHQSILERLVGSGRLYVESAGAMGQEAFIGVPECITVQKAIHQQLAQSRRRWTEQVGGRAPLTVPEQIEKLDELWRRGVITRAEFDAEKARLLHHLT